MVVQSDEKIQYDIDSKEEIDSSHNEQDHEKGSRTTLAPSRAEKALVRKLDYLYVMPFVAILNFLQFFDKSALNYASVLGIMDDAHLDTRQYSWLGSIFYLGYLLYQVPNTILIQKLPLGKYIGGLIIIWGAVLAVTSQGKNFSQLAALRFLLGLFEAGIYPCCIMLISTMYRRVEQPARLGCVYICNGLAMAVGGLVSYGIGYMHNVRGMSAWQWIMIILGCATVFFGLFCFFLLVDNPRSRFLRLTEAEKQLVEDRVRDNAVVRNKEIKYSHIIEALKEPRFYCFAIVSMLMNFQNGALNTFTTIITQGFGFSDLNAILLSVPSGVTDCIYIAFAVWYNRRYGHTIYLTCILLIISIIGLILLLVIPLPQAKLAGLYMCWSFAAAYTLLLVSLANNVSGYTKKIFYSSAIIVMYTVGNFAGPQMLQPPDLVNGMVGYIVSNAVSIILLLIARHQMARVNKQRLSSATERPANAVMEDLTDQEDPNFIYRL
ncbi:major facilitator superfamily domain-containing protein [Radiomyces spectabilis]|uniref:major facilitator superfamily domain-containing protein n=1 Tax=Radiomyces spectabilis TaxID=64574 RepID=UPI0022204481|nr:major facilitator superfamily domain-containing protein [Radiomyces spectabilis]KAI8377441.1 major facilitator superfamily domain-containing protein [Radiomyces spectabilis]